MYPLVSNISIVFIKNRIPNGGNQHVYIPLNATKTIIFKTKLIFKVRH